MIVFKINKDKATYFKRIIKSYNQYDWGINENFYLAASEALKLDIFNLFKYVNIIKFDNDLKSFKENREWQINSWKENQQYLLNFLKDNKLSKKAYGSYYYLLLKKYLISGFEFKIIIIVFYFLSV